MIVAHDRRFAFIRIGKTGTTTLRSVLEQYGEAWPLTAEEFALYNRNIPAHHAREKLGPDVWARCFTFSVVRNPWDWAISNLAYNQGKLPFTTPFHPRKKVTAEQIRELRDLFREHYHRGVTWSETITQKSRLSDPDGNLLVDFVAKLERIQDDFDTICERAAIPKAKLPRLNRTRRKAYHRYYTDETRDLVAELWRDDVDAFGYTYD